MVLGVPGSRPVGHPQALGVPLHRVRPPSVASSRVPYAERGEVGAVERLCDRSVSVLN
jgi:hypothetical protein